MSTTVTPFIYWKLWVLIKEQREDRFKKLSKNAKDLSKPCQNPLKTIYKMLRPGILPVFGDINIYLQQISGNVREEVGLYFTHSSSAGVLFPSEQVSQLQLQEPS